MKRLFHGHFETPCTHAGAELTKLDKNRGMWAPLQRIRRSLSLEVTTHQLSASLHSACTSQPVNEVCNGINTHGVERPQGHRRWCCIVRGLFNTSTACCTEGLDEEPFVFYSGGYCDSKIVRQPASVWTYACNERVKFTFNSLNGFYTDMHVIKAFTQDVPLNPRNKRKPS